MHEIFIVTAYSFEKQKLGPLWLPAAIDRFTFHFMHRSFFLGMAMRAGVRGGLSGWGGIFSPRLETGPPPRHPQKNKYIYNYI